MHVGPGIFPVEPGCSVIGHDDEKFDLVILQRPENVDVRIFMAIQYSPADTLPVTFENHELVPRLAIKIAIFGREGQFILLV